MPMKSATAAQTMVRNCIVSDYHDDVPADET